MMMAYKLDLRKSVFNVFGKLNTYEISELFKDKPNSRAISYWVLKDCRDKKQIVHQKRRPPKLRVRTTKNLVLSAKNNVGNQQGDGRENLAFKKQ